MYYVNNKPEYLSCLCNSGFKSGNLGLKSGNLVQLQLIRQKNSHIIKNMKITINTDSQYTDTEIVINCSRMSEDIEKMLSILRVYDLKLTGHKDGKQYIIEAKNVMYIESIEKRSFLYTINDIFESSLRLYELETKLSDANFLRASKNCEPLTYFV